MTTRIACRTGRGVPLLGKGVRLSLPTPTRSSSTTAAPASSEAAPFIDLARAVPDFETASLCVLPEVITVQEEQNLVAELEGDVRRRRYVASHWDSVIEKYREVEKRQWQDAGNAAVADKIRTLILETLGKRATLPFLPVHLIDLAEDGFIKPHVDSIKFSGDIVSGLSLLSPAIMQLKGDAEQGMDPSSIIRLLLPPRSLYVLTGQARYKYAHEILPRSTEADRWKDGQPVARGRRLSLIFRDAKEEGER